MTEVYKEMKCCGAKQFDTSFTNILSFINSHVSLICDVDDNSYEFTMDNEVYVLQLGWIMRT
jgi:hypothetical protein